MKLRFAGPCSRCGAVIPAGQEAEYDGATKTVKHWECQQAAGPSEELADRLGFIQFDADLPADGLLLRMHFPD